MKYKNELLFPGDLGYLFIALSFGMALLSLVAYIFYFYKPETKSWRKIGRIAFGIHGVSVIGIAATLFYLIYHHRFEYHYVWAHSSLELATHYMISCFWEGQEGSFLLWTFWHVILGGVLIKTIANHREAGVMSVVGVAQLTLTSMLLGFSLGETNIGSNPFILLRDAMSDAPIFQLANYVDLIEDGSGLNPLLQNYWMVIHPPVLFLGFAASIVPFAFAIDALWRKDMGSWIKPALPWTIFTVMILGTGILMGGAWAYEALNFGGYWAWDPVENAALVPWLLIIAGLHTMVIYQNRKGGLTASFLFAIFSFLTILYATFLTRSGVLGESSVHSFTDLGLSGQLLLFMFLFVGIALFFMVTRWKLIPKTEKEEEIYSREFWMFIGALVLTISAVHIFFFTSLPVINKLFGTNFAPAEDPVAFYNRYQLPIAVVIGIITGFAQFLKYKKTKPSVFYKALGISMGISVVLTAGLAYLVDIYNFVYLLLMFAGIYAIVGNLQIMLPLVFKKKIKFTGGAIAHAGFGLMLIGILISSANKNVISLNKSGIDYGESFDMKNKMENIMLIKNKPMVMSNYLVTYLGDSTSAPNTYYKVQYHKLDKTLSDTVESFILKPLAQVNPDMGLVASPDTRHYWSKDIFTYVFSVPDKSDEAYHPKYPDEPKDYVVQIGDTIELRKGLLVVRDINPQIADEDLKVKNAVVATSLDLEILSKPVNFKLEPAFILTDDRNVKRTKAEAEDIAVKVYFQNIRPDENAFEIRVYEGEKEVQDYIIMKAIEFPYINFLWIGSFVLVIGFSMSIYRRFQS